MQRCRQAIILEAAAILATVVTLTAAWFGPSPPGLAILPSMAPLAALGAPRLWAARWRSWDGAPDIQLAAYAGPSYTAPSDVRVREPDGTDLTLEGVPWRGEPFKPPPYYGYRGAWWPGAAGRLGLMLDFTHIKAEAVEAARVRHLGTRGGKPLTGERRTDETFSRLEFTHGYNLLTLNALFRPASARVQPYVGVGAGIAIPHVEMQWRGAPKTTRTSEYQITGPVFQVLAGSQDRVP